MRKLENNKNFLQKWLRCRDGIKSTETNCHTAKQHLAVGHTCKGVAPYSYIIAQEENGKEQHLNCIHSAMEFVTNVMWVVVWAVWRLVVHIGRGGLW